MVKEKAHILAHDLGAMRNSGEAKAFSMTVMGAGSPGNWCFRDSI